MKDRTKAYTLGRLKHHVLPLLGHKRVTEVGAGEIKRFVRDVGAGKTAKDEKIAPRKRIIVRGGDGAARKVVRDLSAVFSFDVRRGITPDNPVERAAIRKTDTRRERFLTLEEVSRIGHAFDEVEAAGTLKAGLPGITPHTLRHTMGSTAVSFGEALALTGAILGHANPRSTAIYAHVQYDPSRRAADRVTRRIADALAGKSLKPVDRKAVGEKSAKRPRTLTDITA